MYSWTLSVFNVMTLKYFVIQVFGKNSMSLGIGMPWIVPVLNRLPEFIWVKCKIGLQSVSYH